MDTSLIKPEDFQISIKQLQRTVWEAILLHKETNRKFGAMINCLGQPNAAQIFEHFKAKSNEFFIDLEEVEMGVKIEVEQKQEIKEEQKIIKQEIPAPQIEEKKEEINNDKSKS